MVSFAFFMAICNTSRALATGILLYCHSLWIHLSDHPRKFQSNFFMVPAINAFSCLILVYSERIIIGQNMLSPHAFNITSQPPKSPHSTPLSSQFIPPIALSSLLLLLIISPNSTNTAPTPADPSLRFIPGRVSSSAFLAVSLHRNSLPFHPR